MLARYTETLKDLMNNEQTKGLLDKALSTYPLYKPKKSYDLIPGREELNKRLLNNYKYREIGFETVGRFLDELEITMCAIMPYYNEMFKTVEIMADLENPFDNVDVVETFKETRTDKASSEADSTTTTEGANSQTDNTENSGNSGENKSRKFSDTPQNKVSDIDSYLTDYTEEKNEQNFSNESTNTSSGTSSNEAISSSTGSSEAEGSTEHTLTRKGNQGVNTYAHDMNEFRTSIIDVVDQIINDKRIQELFMLVY